MFQNYSQISLYSQSSLIQNYVLYPILVEVIKNKAIIIIILAFI